VLCCAERRSISRSAPSTNAAAAAAATDPSPPPSSSANLDNKHSASKAPVPDTSKDAELARQIAEACQYDDPEPDTSDWEVEDGDQTDDDFIPGQRTAPRTRSRSSSRQRTSRSRSQSPAAARTNAKEEKQKKCKNHDV
jgi:hypothetical protein